MVRRTLILSLALLLLLTMNVLLIAAPTLAQQSEISKLLKRGIEVPSKITLPPSKSAVEFLKLSLKKFTLVKIDKEYVLPMIKPSTGRVEYIAIPGAPMIPYVIISKTIRGYVDEAQVRVLSVKVDVLKLHKVKLAPAPPAHTFTPKAIKVTFGEHLYSEDTYIPNRVAYIDVYRIPKGFSVINVYVYPMIYNPVKQELLVIKEITLEVVYSKPLSAEVTKPPVIIITDENLVQLVNETFAELYRSFNYTVDIVSVQYINETYKPAPNITEYPGFYAPAVEDSIYQYLVEHYNWQLALKIQEFLNETYAALNRTPFYVVLIGSAKTIPPSFYFQYMYMYGYLDPYNSWIPTDYFYADIVGRDLKPELYIGRIPFDSPENITHVYNKTVEWYNTPVAAGSKLIISGGYTFLDLPMFGEQAIATMTVNGSISTFDVETLTRTSENYNASAVLSVFAGNRSATWYFIIAHGSGDSFGDWLILDIGRFTFETLATNQQLLSLPTNYAVPIISSVACINGAWDTDLVPPDLSAWPFTLPSIGQAVLLSNASGVAYIGSARIAWEILGPVELQQGLAVSHFYGATKLHVSILETYNFYRMIYPGMGVNATLADVVWGGIASYSSIVESLGMIAPYLMEIGISEIFKLSLLGDPVLQLPSMPYMQPYQFVKFRVMNPEMYIDGEYVLLWWGTGTVPLCLPYEEGLFDIILTDYTGLGSVTVEIRFIKPYPDVYGYGYLWGYKIVKVDSVTLSPLQIEYYPMYPLVRAVYSVIFEKLLTGKLLVKIVIPHAGEVRLYVVASLGGLMHALNTSMYSVIEMHNETIMSRLNALNKTIMDVYALLKQNTETLDSVVESLEILDNRTVVIKTILGEIRGVITSVNDTVVTIETSVGELHLKVDDLKRLFETGKSDIMSLIRSVNASMGSILEGLVEDIRILNNRTIVIETAIGEIRGTIARIDGNVLVINTSIGKVLVRLDTIEEALSSKIEESKSEILSGLTKNVETITKVVYEQVTSVGAKVDTSTTLNAIMTGIVYIVVLGAAAAIIKRR